jgi:hypothetical protein
MYISSLAANAPFQVEITYKPSASPITQPESFGSKSKEVETTEKQSLTIQALTPSVYTTILNHHDAVQWFEAQIQSSPVPADDSSRSLWVSDESLLKRLLACADSAISKSDDPPTWGFRARKGLIARLRKSNTTEPSFMDRFVYHNLSASMQIEYQNRVIRLLIPHRFGFLGSDIMFSAYNTVGRVVVASIGLRLIYGSTVVSHFVGLEDLSIASSVCILLYGAWKLSNF